MKIPYSHLVNHIESKPNIVELSKKLFQLGHEHEIHNNIFDMELTPNRGDCLSLSGILKDLRLFYKIKDITDIYDGQIKPFSFDFTNNSKSSCSKISFLKVEINNLSKNYSGPLNDFFSDLGAKKNNFFTDISNFIMYETGQPTHCYESDKVIKGLKLDFVDKKFQFETLLDTSIAVSGKNLIFFNKNNEAINLAGIIGSKNSACSKDTMSVIIECAHFDPESIIGKSVKYGINSDAAHRFERGTDYNCHDYVLRRFLRIIEEHAEIISAEIFSQSYSDFKIKKIPFNLSKINTILGTKINEADSKDFLQRLDFIVKEEMVHVPSFRNDIETLNDLAEEIARSIGYDNIKTSKFSLTKNGNKEIVSNELKMKNLLIDNGFYEVINDPFVSKKNNLSISVDNPLDSNRRFLRTDLKNSLIENLLYNERRQQDSIKLFEIANIYTKSNSSFRRVLGIIGSGRVGKNYKDFSKNINVEFFKSVFSKFIDTERLDIINISRDSLDTKLKNQINYLEIEIDASFKIKYETNNLNKINIHNKLYTPVSDFPSSTRDLSFSIKNYSKCMLLEDSMLNFKNDLIKDIFIFDYFKNDNANEIKIGFRFVFQSIQSTITEIEVNKVMESIINLALGIESVSIPGLK